MPTLFAVIRAYGPAWDRAAVAARLAADPWGADMLALVRVEEWTLRLDALGGAPTDA
jgi:hypothetical protein